MYERKKMFKLGVSNIFLVITKKFKRERERAQTRWCRNRCMWSTSLSTDTSGIHLQKQKCMQNTSWEWTGVPDQQKRIYRITQNLVVPQPRDPFMCLNRKNYREILAQEAFWLPATRGSKKKKKKKQQKKTNKQKKTSLIGP